MIYKVERKEAIPQRKKNPNIKKKKKSGLTYVSELKIFHVITIKTEVGLLVFCWVLCIP